MEQFKPHLDKDEHNELTRLGAQEILESTRVTSQEDLRKDLLNRQQTLTGNLQAITNEVANVSKQEKGQYLAHTKFSNVFLQYYTLKVLSIRTI